MSVIHVVAILTAKPGMRQQVLDAFQANVPNVHAEEGCIQYEAVIDADGFGAFQTPAGDDTFFVVEQWASADALKAHAATPHMAAYGNEVKDMMADRKVYVMQPA